MKLKLWKIRARGLHKVNCLSTGAEIIFKRINKANGGTFSKMKNSSF